MRELFYRIALLFLASTIFIGCNTDEPESITVSDKVTLNQTVYADQKTGSNIRFTTTAAWRSSIASHTVTERSAIDWLTITPSSGNAGDNNITLNLQPNTTGQNRSAIITITSGNASIDIRITQQGINEPIAVTGVTLAGCTSLIIGQTHQLAATVLPETATNRALTWASSNNSVATVNNYGLVTAVTAGIATITVTTVDGERTATCIITVTATPPIAPPTPTTDPGVVINGIRWATRNVNAPGTFADSPQDAGMFFQWRRITGLSITNPLRHWANGDWVVGGWRDYAPFGTYWPRTNDPCPLGWRVPTREEQESLLNHPNTWTQQNGVRGRLFDTELNQLFFPSVGFRWGESLYNEGFSAHYWSSTGADNVSTTWGLDFFGNNDGAVKAVSRIHGFSVRCVAE